MKFLKRWIDLPVLQIARQFPYLVLASLAVSIYLSLIILDVVPDEYHGSMVVALIPGIVLGLSEGLWRMKTKLPLWSIIAYVIIAQLTFFYLADKGFDEEWMGFRFFIFVGIVHLVFAAGIWLFTRDNEKYWEQNISILLRLLSATILALLLWGSVNLILSLIDYLFIPGDFVDDEVIGISATWAFLFYHPMYFAAGLLNDSDEDPVTNHKVYFSAISYILTPLMWVYIAIMFAYFIKIGIQWEWPIGGVSYWIAALSVFGTLLYLLGYRYFKEGKTKLNEWYDKLFFILTVPVILLLFIAIYTRINAYGWTENRYFVVFAGIWLLVISLYFIISRKKALFVIPLTLGFVLLISSVGPWNAYSVARSSQMHELEELLTNSGILTSDGLNPDVSTLPSADRSRIRNISSFLDDRGAMKTFIENHVPQLLEEQSEDEEVNYELLLSRNLNLKTLPSDNGQTWVYIKSTSSLKELDLSNFQHVWYVNQHDRSYNAYPTTGIETKIKDSLLDLSTSSLALDEDGQFTNAPCVSDSTNDVRFTFCCTDCQVSTIPGSERVDQIIGVLYFNNLVGVDE